MRLYLASRSRGIRPLALWAGFLLLGAPALQAEPPLLDPPLQTGIDNALAHLNMTRRDLGFAKDVGEPRTALSWIRGTLENPLELPPRADVLLAAAASTRPEDPWRLIANWLEAEGARNVDAPADDPAMWEGLDRSLAEPLSIFLSAARQADVLLKQAFAKLNPDERSYLAASFWAATMDAGDDEAARKAIVAAGVLQADLDLVLRENLELDPEPAALKFLELSSRLDTAALLQAARIFQQAVDTLAGKLTGKTKWPEASVTILTELGKIVISNKPGDTHEGRALLIIDRTGPTTYLKQAGVANGFRQQSLAAIIDLEGDDRYIETGALLGAGSALFGIAVIHDTTGDDSYRSAYAGQGAAVFGAAWLHELQGNDQYDAGILGQGAAFLGTAVLQDLGGNDQYSCGLQGQGFAGQGGFGLLVDAKGNDSYTAGGVVRDHERNDDRYLSMAQGFAIGNRPYSGGGIGALVDLAGNDTYSADIYGQGVSYWYSAAFLIDRAGNDNYLVYQYGQGTGIHLSLGLLADGAGNDRYQGEILVQGAAHDYAVGMLFDQEGRDTYAAGNDSQGHGMNNAFGLLADGHGDDAYFVRSCGNSQGAGNSGGHRDYGSLALLLDLEGTDLYSCGATDGARQLRPLYGIVYDFSKETAP